MYQYIIKWYRLLYIDCSMFVISCYMTHIRMYWINKYICVSTIHRHEISHSYFVLGFRVKKIGHRPAHKVHVRTVPIHIILFKLISSGNAHTHTHTQQVFKNIFSEVDLKSLTLTAELYRPLITRGESSSSSMSPLLPII